MDTSFSSAYRESLFVPSVFNTKHTKSVKHTVTNLIACVHQLLKIDDVLLLNTVTNLTVYFDVQVSVECAYIRVLVYLKDYLNLYAVSELNWS